MEVTTRRHGKSAAHRRGGAHVDGAILRYAIQVLDSLHDGVVAVDSEGYVIYANEANTRITGLTRDQVVGRHVSEVVPNSHILDVLASRTPLLGVRTRVFDHVVVSNIVPVYHQGRMVGAVSVFRDITEVLALSRQLDEARNTIDLLRENLTAAPVAEDGVIIGQSPAAQRMYLTARKAATVDSPVLIEGESGTGKEVMARLIHNRSARRSQPLIAVNCAAIPGTLLESELFGYEEGAFTGSRKGGRPGLFQLADGGTLFLDEIGDMDPGLQAKLLRALQSGEIRRVGGTTVQKVNVRIISATNQNLAQLVREKRFREDLYYRLRVIHLVLPPLRERRADLPLFLEHAMRRVCERLGRPPARFSPAALRALMAYPFPGNIRELENVVEQAVVLAEGDVIDVGDLPPDVVGAETAAAGPADRSGDGWLGLNDPGTFPTLEEVERRVLEAGLRAFDSKAELARHLGLSRATLYRKLARYGLA
ncbi:sigma-54-dependent transcriptional regulator [Symbiobacterium thermophilum IAM 14863]|uniref:Sigma-54-dependent transcriptional regulator n=2 Tax=Symbiobacterium thermophilum TaxID=2734 RepID=Q67SC0_SYMTH|nr:sigma-54-dependent transcriptional regulator [Symbiobacterium thermophilum IAM 14863]